MPPAGMGVHGYTMFSSKPFSRCDLFRASVIGHIVSNFGPLKCLYNLSFPSSLINHSQTFNLQMIINECRISVPIDFK